MKACQSKRVAGRNIPRCRDIDPRLFEEEAFLNNNRVCSEVAYSVYAADCGVELVTPEARHHCVTKRPSISPSASLRC